MWRGLFVTDRQTSYLQDANCLVHGQPVQRADKDQRFRPLEGTERSSFTPLLALAPAGEVIELTLALLLL
jgi:hypothetical protein